MSLITPRQMGLKAGEVVAADLFECRLRKVRAPDGQACWVTPSAGDVESATKHTADGRFSGTGKGAKVR